MATATQSTLIQELDTKKRSSTSRHFEDALRQKIVGQDEAVEALVELYQVFCAELHSPGRPVGNHPNSWLPVTAPSIAGAEVEVAHLRARQTAADEFGCTAHSELDSRHP